MRSSCAVAARAVGRTRPRQHHASRACGHGQVARRNNQRWQRQHTAGLATGSSAAVPMPKGVAAALPVTLADIAHETKPVVSVSTQTSMEDAVRVMKDREASTLFVEDGGLVRGVLSEAGAVRHAAASGFDFGCSIDEVMSVDVTYAHLGNTIRDSLRLLNACKQDHLPILQTPRVEGGEEEAGSVKVDDVRLLDVSSIISAKQVIGQFYAEAVGPVSELDLEERLKLEHEAHAALKLPTVKTIMKNKKTRNEAKGEMGRMVLNTVVQDEITVAEVIGQLSKFDKGSVAVMDVCRDVPVLVGITTERDIVRRVLAEGLDPEETLVTDIMTSSELATVTSRDTLLACAYKMIQFNVRHLPVVSPRGEHILAMISSGDVVAYLDEALKAE